MQLKKDMLEAAFDGEDSQLKKYMAEAEEIMEDVVLCPACFVHPVYPEFPVAWFAPASVLKPSLVAFCLPAVPKRRWDSPCKPSREGRLMLTLTGSGERC